MQQGNFSNYLFLRVNHFVKVCCLLYEKKTKHVLNFQFLVGDINILCVIFQKKKSDRCDRILTLGLGILFAN